MSLRRTWVHKYREDPTSVLEDWDYYCYNPDGVFVETEFSNEPPDLPPVLAKIREDLAVFIPDEHTKDKLDAPFNGPGYYLKKVDREVRRFGEIPGCSLTFGPSDYRTFIATNGMNDQWAKRLGISDTEYKGHANWVKRWTEGVDHKGFFANSFGVNVLVTVRGEDDERYALFVQRGHRVAVGPVTTVGSVDEGLRTRYGNNLFDEKSPTDRAPDIPRAAIRGLEEEVGLTQEILSSVKPTLMSVGMVRSLYQPAALFHLPLDIKENELRKYARLAKDRGLESEKRHFVRLSINDIADFIEEQEKIAPVFSWAAVMALYASKSRGYQSVFISYCDMDKDFASRLYNDLNEVGVHVRKMPEDATPGKDIEASISEAIDDCERVLLIASKESLNRMPVLREIRRAMVKEDKNWKKGVKKHVLLPVRIDDFVLNWVDELADVVRKQWVADFSKPKEYDSQFKSLLKELLKPTSSIS